jgi:3'-phosphoadenosine 5'-phosphosulfate sulfotransferase (PAPS reductase)/FAD synthetase
MIVRRQAGDMIQRWEGRWAANLRRYENLECVTLITPWSTPAMRFCTSELKVSPICSALKKRWPTGIILSASGIRAEESPNRAKAPIAKEQAKLKRRGQVGFDWHPILSWKLTDVLALHEAENFPLHPAYTQFGSSRLSCAFCMLARMEDHLAALKQKGNHPSYHRLVALEVASGFSFQQNRWLGDRMPELLAEDTLNQIQLSKEKGRLRREAESAIPKSVLFVKGWPHAMPTVEEAQLLADARTKVCALIGIENRFPTVKSVQDRYGELLREAGKDQSCLPGLAEEESGGDLVLCA